MFVVAAMAGLPAVLPTPIDTIVSAFITVMVAVARDSGEARHER
jgi:hypothetical protein